MAQDHRVASRTEPRLWVDTLWILKSLEASVPIREIPLVRGLNLILSPPVEGSAGHGVGKTAFCQLLRFVLEDPQWAAGSPLRDELLHSLPDGAAAARVHLNGDIWTVLKPWRHQKQYRAAKNATWQQLAANEVTNEHTAYLQELQDSLVGILPVRQLPGSNQPIQWQHVLAWCSRDQGSRYQSYYQWRTEGTGFTLPAQSPALLVKIVLGMLKDASTLESLRKQENAYREAQDDLVVLERQPTDLLAHVKSQLTRWLHAPRDSPFRTTSLFDQDSLVARARQRLEGYEKELAEANTRQARIEAQRAEALERRAPLASQAAMQQNQVRQLEAAIAGNLKEVERLRKEPESLQQLFPKHCEPGNRLYRDCDYVVQRVNNLQFERAQDVAGRKKWEEELQAELKRQQEHLAGLQRDLGPLDAAVAKSADEIGAVTDQRVALMRDLQRLRDAIADCENYEAVVAGSAEWPSIAEKRASVIASEGKVQKLKAQAKAEQETYKKRHGEINQLMNAVAAQLPGFKWGVFDQEKRPPFHMGPMHSTTFGVLETLAGDIVCLMDSANPESLHPGFLLHDSPREAEMSEAVFWALLAVVRRDRHPPFQYIVTTSTGVQPNFEPFVRLTLNSKETDGYLFRERIGADERILAL